MYAHHKSKSQDLQHQCSPLLFSFIRKGKFNWENLDQTNSYGVTPLTEAVSSNEETVILELLKLGVNPIIENIHGNTPLSLSQQKPQFLKIIEQAIEHRICEVLMCKIDTEFYYNNKTYRIKKILKGGSCSLAVIEIENNHTLEQYFAKIKPYFGGLEIRNYIFLEQYIDLFIIKNLMLYSNEQKNSRIIKNVYCLVQKIVPGQSLSIVLTSTPEDKQQIIVGAIKSLCKLHQQGYIHNDALPDNCCWNKETKEAFFIDYDVMRTLSDLKISKEEWEEAEYLDLKRLIMGDVVVRDGIVVQGLMCYIENIKNILESLDSSVLSSKHRRRLLADF